MLYVPDGVRTITEEEDDADVDADTDVGDCRGGGEEATECVEEDDIGVGTALVLHFPGGDGGCDNVTNACAIF
jgi:hypothetical protein